MKILSATLLDQFRTPGRCEICQAQCKRKEPHHIFACGTGCHKQLDVPINLVSLGSSALFCCACHTRYHQEHKPTRIEMLAIAAAREGMDADECQEAIWFLQRQKKMLFECQHNAGWIKVGKNFFVCKDCGAEQ